MTISPAWQSRRLGNLSDAVRVGEILAQAAQAEIMPRFRTLNAEQVRQKSSSFDLVTEADEAAEKAISKELAAAFPGSGARQRFSRAHDRRAYDTAAQLFLAAERSRGPASKHVCGTFLLGCERAHWKEVGTARGGIPSSH